MSLNTLSSNYHSNTKPARSLAWMLPIALILGFLTILTILFGNRLIPATKVTTTQALTIRLASGEGSPSSSANTTMLFQASGWIEPDPYTIYVPTLTSGIVDKVNVLEGQSVKKNDILATLISEDAQLDFDQAQQQLQTFTSNIAAHSAGLHIIQAEILAKEKNIDSLKSQLASAQDNLNRLNRLDPGAVPKQQIIQASLELQRQSALVAEAQAEIPGLNARFKQIELERDSKYSQLRELEISKKRAKLALDRTSITSPTDGIVLALHAAPGKKRFINMDDPNSAVIVELYDPEHLQARIDVPLSEAADLQIGQSVELSSDLLPDTTFNGIVTRITGQADLQRNTLQVKVAIKNPDRRLRPEMLVRAKFYSLASTSSSGTTSSQRLSIYAPESAIIGDSSIWIATIDSTAELRTIKSTTETRDGYRRITEGLRSGEQIILPPHDALKPGKRIKISNRTK